MRPEILARITGSQNGVILLEQMKISDSEIVEIIAKIREVCPNVSTINLDGNRISDRGAILLGGCLDQLANIKELSVQFNQIGKKGALGLFGLKKEHHNLDILFHGNKITNAREMLDIERQATTQPPSLGRC